MESNFVARRLAAFLPIAGIAIVALVAVITAMTVLGGTESLATPSPSPSPSSTPTASIAASPTTLAMPSDTSSPVIMALLPSAPPIQVAGRKIDRDPNGIWLVDIRYPELKTDSTPFAAAVNDDIFNEVQTRFVAFENGPAAIVQTPGVMNTFTGTYTTDLLTPDLVSYTERWVDDTAGAQPATTVTTMNYWLKTGQRLDLEDIFYDLPGALAIISQQSRDQLHRLLGAGYDPNIADAGTSAAIANFGGWALTATGLKVTLAEFQVGTAEVGLPVVLVPWSVLAGVMQPNGPAARLAGLPGPS